jgi:phage gp36-like protein
MPYSTQAQLQIRYGVQLLTELSDRADVSSGLVDAALFTRVIADADALIDGYLGGRYQLPLAATPELVTDLSQRIAIYYAHANVASDKITKDYDIALKQLRDIASGLVKLSVAGAGVEATGGSTNEVITNEPERPFTATSMKGFI